MVARIVVRHLLHVSDAQHSQHAGRAPSGGTEDSGYLCVRTAHMTIRMNSRAEREQAILRPLLQHLG